MKVHHNTLKKAKKYAIVLTVEDNEIVASTKDGERLTAGLSGNKVLEAAIAMTGGETPKSPAAPKKARKAAKKKAKRRVSDGEDGDEDEEEGDEDEGKSVIKQKYKNKYKPHKMTCGDALARQIRAEFMTVKDPDTKKLKIDWKRFTEFAKRNACWSEEYKKVNKGMRRMNIVNRLRAKVQAGHEVVWSTN